LDAYEGSVLLRIGAAALGPVTWGLTTIADAGLVSALALVRTSRLRTFGEGLIALNLRPPKEEIESKQFLEAFVATATKVANTTREEKINLLAKLFATYWKTGAFDRDTFDKYEEDLSIIDELGYKEFLVLLALEELESKHPLESGMNVLMRARQFWPEFEKKCAEVVGIPEDQVTATYND
jgi:hypothetical protein